MYEPEILIGGGFPAAEGWYATIAAPHLLDDPKSADWVKRYAGRYNKQPNDYCITSNDAVPITNYRPLPQQYRRESPVNYEHLPPPTDQKWRAADRPFRQAGMNLGARKHRCWAGKL
ncbi:MAG: hypothetical protein WA864_23280 [Acetobacteraceae bacterium]